MPPILIIEEIYEASLKGIDSAPSGSQQREEPMRMGVITGGVGALGPFL
jgi:hypothetical protein